MARRAARAYLVLRPSARVSSLGLVVLQKAQSSSLFAAL
jgi:hypothetical protein